jgi:hypothetical protein
MRWPILPTLLVALAAATMVALGVWQLQRKGEKEAMIALHQRNIVQKAEVAFPLLGPVDERLYFRRSRVTCLEPISFSPRAGQDAAGRSTYRTIVDCRTGAEGPGVLIAVGTSDDVQKPPEWRGGEVAGMIVPGPDQPGLLQKLTGTAVPARAMLVADPPVPGWGSNARPAPDDVPNNHLVYAGQWFLFAIAAVVIYILALRRRLRG